MAPRSVIADARDVRRASELIELGARLQVLESETSLSRERLLRLYKEIQGRSPPKGMLPFSTDWFITWMPNIHASLFLGIYQNVIQASELDEIDAIIKTYRLYLEQCSVSEQEIVLSLTRAWRLVKFVDAGMLRTVPCTRCAGQFVAHTHDLHDGFVCGLCHMPSRAGKTKAAKESLAAADIPLNLRRVH
jgi:flagellar transcriptional activator FlhC